MNVGAESSSPVPGIFALEINESVDCKETAGTLVCVAASLDECEDGLVDVDPSGVLGAGVIVVVVIKYLLGELCSATWLAHRCMFSTISLSTFICRFYILEKEVGRTLPLCFAPASCYDPIPVFFRSMIMTYCDFKLLVISSSRFLYGSA